MTKFPLLIYNTKNTKCPAIAPPAPPSRYEDVVGWPMVEKGYKNALRGQRKFTREAVRYDLFSEINNVGLWRELNNIGVRYNPDQKEYGPGKYRHRIITEPKTRSLHTGSLGVRMAGRGKIPIKTGPLPDRNVLTASFPVK